MSALLALPGVPASVLSADYYQGQPSDARDQVDF